MGETLPGEEGDGASKIREGFFLNENDKLLWAGRAGRAGEGAGREEGGVMAVIASEKRTCITEGGPP
jgi:hypothetical protein